MSSHCNGQVFEAPFYFSFSANGYNSRMGVSNPVFQYGVQNVIHKFVIHTPFFVDYNYFKGGLYLGGIYNAQYFGLW